MKSEEPFTVIHVLLELCIMEIENTSSMTGRLIRIGNKIRQIIPKKLRVIAEIWKMIIRSFFNLGFKLLRKKYFFFIVLVIWHIRRWRNCRAGWLYNLIRQISLQLYIFIMIRGSNRRVFFFYLFLHFQSFPLKFFDYFFLFALTFFEWCQRIEFMKVNLCFIFILLWFNLTFMFWITRLLSSLRLDYLLFTFFNVFCFNSLRFLLTIFSYGRFFLFNILIPFILCIRFLLKILMVTSWKDGGSISSILCFFVV